MSSPPDPAPPNTESVQPRRQNRGCFWLQAGVAFVVLIVLAWVWVPPRHGLLRGQMVQSINNQRQIYLAAYQMATDGLDSKDPLLGWPGDLARSTEAPVTSLAEYVKRLEDYDYLRRADIGKVFAGPGLPADTGAGEFSSANSAFKIYKVRNSDVADVLFSATKNFTFGKGLDPKAVPYGEKGFCVLRKGGDATPFYNKQSAFRTNLGLMPGSTNRDDPGTETNDSILSM